MLDKRRAQSKNYPTGINVNLRKPESIPRSIKVVSPLIMVDKLSINHLCADTAVSFGQHSGLVVRRCQTRPNA
jgi:hypothetical protein